MRNHVMGFSCVALGLMVAAFLVAGTNSPAATISNWTGNGNDGLWSDGLNWDAGVPNTGFAATFNGAGNGFTSIKLGNGTQPINTIAFTGTPAAYTLGTNPNGLFNFDSGGNVGVASSVTTAQTIAASINTGGALTVTNAGTGGLTFGGALSLGGTMTVTNSGTSALTTFNGPISGSGGITLGGGGTILLAGNNTYSGLTNLSSGTATNIEIGSDTAFGTGILQPNNGANSPLEAFGADRTIPNQVNLLTGFTVANAATQHNLTFTGAISDPGVVITNNMFASTTNVALFLGGSGNSPSVITMSGTTKFQTTSFTPSETIIFDQLTGATANLTIQNNALVQILNGTNNYGGATSITRGGILGVYNTSGSATGTSTVSVTGAGTGPSAVGSGGWLAGTGFISGTITISSTSGGSQGGILGAGDTGTLHVGSMIFNPFGRYIFDYNQQDNTTFTDLVKGSGTLDLTALSASAPFDVYLIPSISGPATQTYTLVTFANGILANGTALPNGTDVTNLFTFSGSYPSAPDLVVASGPDGTGQSLVLSFAPTPEPTGTALLAVGAAGGLLRRRRPAESGNKNVLNEL